MIKPTFDLENKLREEGYGLIIGIDEAGRGPLAGPVVACAATVRNFEIINPKSLPEMLSISKQAGEIISKLQTPNSKLLDLIRDSKTLSHKQRENLFDFIHEHFYVGVGICDRQTIDRMNILEASFLAMKKAVTDLQKSIKRLNLEPAKDKSRLVILIDGNKKISNFSHEQRAVVSGDKIVKSISAASIIAKVTRDRIMMEMHEKYPEYNFAQHKGYGTKLHLEMLKKHGPCDIHRRSFKPVGKLVKAKN